VGQWTIARRQGDEQRIEELTRQLRLTLCTPSTEVRRVLAGYLSDQNEHELSEEAYKVLLLMTAMGSDERTEFVYVASDYAMMVRDRDPTSAAKWYDLAISNTLESTAFLPIGYITLPLTARRFLVEAAIASKDHEAASFHVERLLNINPLDIDFAERLLPKLREAGMEDLADKTFDQIFATGQAFMRDFPFDATTSNNLAWVAAMNKRQIDEALALVRRAVDLEPNSAIYRDTLAEVLFQLGRKQEALQIEQACVLDDPGQWHLHQQIEKYQEAVRDERSR
jgi:tetratricopeptide (TPR) repeat protein